MATNRVRVSGIVLAILATGGLVSATTPAGAAFPGTNGRIFFETGRDGFTNIYSMNVNGSNPQEVVGTADRNAEKNPAVSPDGTLVAYERGTGLWVMNVDGSAPRQLTAPSTGSDSDPTWSPDGRKIAFTRSSEIWVMNASDGSAQSNLTRTPDFHEYDPAWSPREDKIAYTRIGCDQAGTGRPCVYSMNADGSAQTNLTPEKEICDRMVGTGPWGNSKEPSWSPDGQRIAFVGPADCSENLFGGWEIWVMTAAGGNKSNLTHDSKSDLNPAFSPDGQSIAFASDRDGSDFEIYTMPSVGGTISQRTNNTARDENPDWAPSPRTSLTINDVSVTEGQSGTKLATFTISRSGNLTGSSTVSWATANGTALAGSDYVAVVATPLTFAANDTSKTVSVTVNGDTAVEVNETFFVKLSAASGATIVDPSGTGTIVNDDTGLAVNDVSVTEGHSGTRLATFTISRSGNLTGSSTVSWATANGTALAGSDYVAVAATPLSFSAGQSAKSVQVQINGDTAVEASETFFVKLSDASGATILDGSGTGTIVNDD